MQNLDPGQSGMEWFIGLLGTVLAGIGAIFLHIYGRIDALRVTATEGDRELWKALNGEREASQNFRVDIVRKVAELPTKDDHKEMERRIMNAIQAVRK